MYNQAMNKLSCMSAQTGTLVFAICNIIATGGASIFSIFFFINSLVTFSYGVSGENPEHNVPMGFFLWAISLFLMMASFIAFVFAVFLIHGITKKNSAHVKAYFVYGVTVAVAATLPFLAIVFSTVSIKKESVKITEKIIIGFSGVFAMFIYSLILVMIRIAYKNIEAVKSQYDHQPLEAQKC